MLKRSRYWSLAIALVLCAVITARAADEPKPILVFGAASLANVLDDLGQAYTARSRVSVKGSYAASSSLARQIEAGAPADVFFSADTDWVDYLDQHHLLKPGTRKDLAGNSLVLIAPADSAVKVKISPHFDIAAAIGNSRLATGDPDSVPVGRYAQAAFEKLGVWKQISGKLVRAENVRAALAFVARGEATLGVVYRTDAMAEPKVKIVDTFPEDTHPPVRYPIALTVNAQPAAAGFVAFVAGADGARLFRKYGFEPLR